MNASAKPPAPARRVETAGAGNPVPSVSHETAVGGSGPAKQTFNFATERVVGNGSFGVVFQATCLETAETVAIKKVLQDKRFKNRELQIMKVVDHPNIIKLKQCFYQVTEKDETYLHLVLEYVPDTVYRCAAVGRRKSASCRTRPAACSGRYARGACACCWNGLAQSNGHRTDRTGAVPITPPCLTQD